MRGVGRERARRKCRSATFIRTRYGSSMPILAHASLAALIALQAAPAAPSDESAEASRPELESFAELPIEEAAAPRCGVAFALVSKWQKAGDARGANWPDMEAEGGREFFVRSMAKLMETRELSRGSITPLVKREVAMLEAEGDDRVEAMMPACLLMKQSAGL